MIDCQFGECKQSDVILGHGSKFLKTIQDNRNFSCIVKILVDAYTVVVRDLVGTRLVCANCLFPSS